MLSVSLTVLGTCSLTVSTTTITQFPTEKVRALLVYLALEPRPHRREAIAELLWPDNRPGMALRNLRLSLFRMRQMLTTIDPQLADRLLFIDRQTIQLAPDILSVDALRFQTAIDVCEQHSHHAISECATCRAQLSAAVAEYQGDLLPHLTLPDAPIFEEWLQLRRETLRNMAQHALHTLTTGLVNQGNYQQALNFANQALLLDRYREENHRQVMLLLAYLGQPQRALSQYQRYCQILKQELGLDPTGEIVTLMQQIKSGQLITPSTHSYARIALSTDTLRPQIVHNNLPGMQTELVGRQRELAELSNLLDSDHMRLLTLIGMGGMGKTRLAIALAQANVAKYRHGAVFIALGALTSTSSLTTLMLNALDLHTEGDPLQYLIRYIRDKQLLLVLDNAEHLLNDVSELALALLQACPHLQILVTSREPLLVRGEHLYHVSALDSEPTSDKQTEQPASVTMFVQCAQRMQANLQLDDETLEQIHTICRLVQGVPLAIELAAAWTAHYSYAEIVHAISESVDFLSFEWRGAPKRQQSMRAVFLWSWNLLSSAEQEALRTVALFQGGFTQEAALAVGSITPMMLIRLSQTSLLSFTEHTNGKRYAMHELLRQYALEQFESDEQRIQAEARHCRYYLAYLASREQRLMDNEPRAAAAEIWAEMDNIRQAWKWASQHAYAAEIEQCVDALYQFYMVSGLVADRLPMFALACEAFAGQAAQPTADAQTRRVYGKLLGFHSMALARTFQIKRAIEVVQLAIAHKQWSPVGMIMAHMAWSLALFNQGDYYGSREQVELALAHNTKAQHNNHRSALQRMVDWAAYVWLSGLNLRLSDYQQAHDYAERSRIFCETYNLQLGRVDSLLILGDVARITYDLPTARRYYEQSQQMASQLASRTTESRILFGLAEVLRLQGEYAQARNVLEHALDVAQATNEQWNGYLLSVALIHLLHLSGNPSLAKHRYLRLSRSDEMRIAPSHRITALLALSAYLLHVGELAEANAHAEEAYQLACRSSHTYDQAHSLVLIAHSRALLQHPQAESAYRQALQIYESIPNQGAAAEAWAGLAALALQRHDPIDAYHAAKQIMHSIDNGLRIGLNEPFFAYQTCAYILQILDDPEAERIQRAANQMIELYAATLDDDHARQAFRERVQANHLLRYTSLGAVG